MIDMDTIINWLTCPEIIFKSLFFVVFAVIIYTSIKEFYDLLDKYKKRKAEYYHDTTHKTNPTHVHMQIRMVSWILVAFICVCAIFALFFSPDFLKWFAGISALLAWICQDTVKNIVAYIILEKNELIKIGDWIILEKYGIDGEVYDISITSVIIKNWDETESSISTQLLLDSNMQNMKNVVEKKTPGRRMQRKFMINVNSVRNLTAEDFCKIESALSERKEDMSALLYAQKHGVTQNLEVYRLYLRHWLLNQKTITRSPKFAIRLLDQTSEGLPMQIYAFLLPTGWEEFEQEQARIVAHVLDTLGLFGLILFQYPAGTDTSNIQLTKKEL